MVQTTLADSQRPVRRVRLSVSIVVTLVVAVLSALVATAFLSLPPAAAEDSADGGAGSVTWSVRPGTAGSADDRSWVELALDPGDTVTEHLILTNHSSRAVTFTLSAADGYFTETGRFNMLSADQTSVGAGTWIDLAEHVDVGPRETSVVPFDVTVPVDATPGDHPAGVAAGIMSDGGTIGVESRVGFRVMTRVTGDISPEMDMTSTATYDGSLNPFRPGHIEVEYTAVNVGNTRLSGRPDITVLGPFGVPAGEVQGEQIDELAPGETRTGTVTVPQVWPLFSYAVEVTGNPRVVGEEQESATPAQASSQVRVTAVPWSQLTVLIVGFVLIFVVNRERRRRRQIIARELAEAHERGRREARERS